MRIVPVLLAGGVGERFWPMSRTHRPKQLLPLTSRKTMLEETLERIGPLCTAEVQPLIVTGKAIAGLIDEQLGSRVSYEAIVEPVGKNTAPAVAVAAAYIQKRYGDSVMVVLSADHAISPQDAFIRAVRSAADIASCYDRLVVFGVRPSRPDTGYGYVEVAEKLEQCGTEEAHVVRRFVEKPDLSTAQTYCASGTYLWNSGMFVWRTSVILAEFSRHMPELHAQVVRAAEEGFSEEALARLYHDCVKESIDYGIMERSDRVAVVTGDFAWDDVGSWESVARIRSLNERGTVALGERTFERDCRDSIIVNDSKLTLAAFGLENIVLVATDDAVLAIPRSELPRIKEHLAAMRATGRAGGAF